jgi:hypothetical protein
VAFEARDGRDGGSVEELTPYPVEPGDVAGRRRRRQLIGMAISIVAVGVVLIGAVALCRDRTGPTELVRDRDGEVADVTLPDATTEVTEADTVVSDDLGLGAPADGKESHLLPVRVTPDHDLVEGQQVTITGAGFPPNASVVAVTCTSAAGRDGADACDILDNFVYTTSDGNGRVSIPTPSTAS